MRSVTRIAADTVLGAALVAVAGCYANDGYYGEGYDYYDYDAQPAYYHDPYPRHFYHDHRDYHRAARRHRIPQDAEVVANGPGGLMYTADRPGRVYVRDERTGKVIYRDRVQAGQKLNIDAERRRIEVDGRKTRGDLSRRPREREVYFRPDRGGAGGRDQPGRGAGDGGRRQKSNDDGPRERREHRGNPGKGKNRD